MKVLFIAPAPPPVGGIESVTDNLINYLKTTPNGTNLILFNTSHRFRPVTSKSLFVRFYSGVYNSIKTYIKVRKFIKKDKPDIIHLASSASLALFKDLLIAKAANDSKIPIVLHWHFGRIPFLNTIRNWEWRLLQKVIHTSTMSIVIDNKSYHTLVTEGISNIISIPNPLSSDIEERARKLKEKSLNRPIGRLIYVGHLIYDKGVYELVTVCSQTSIINELILIGPYEKSVKEDLIKIAKQRSSDTSWLKFTGSLNIDQVLDHMMHSPVLVLPSYTEGFPMVILEAMAMGCAIIATDVGAISEMLGISTNMPTGICIPPKNIDKLREAIVDLAGDQSKLESFGKRGMNRVLENYTMEKVYHQYLSVWNKLYNDFST